MGQAIAKVLALALAAVALVLAKGLALTLAAVALVLAKVLAKGVLALAARAALALGSTGALDAIVVALVQTVLTAKHRYNITEIQN